MGNNFCLWLTGLPGSGKTTITQELEELLVKQGVNLVILSMDRMRLFLTPDPKYTEQEREIVYRALVMVAQLLMEHSAKSVIIDATGNRRHFRELARASISDFAEVYIKCDIEVAREREASRETPAVEKDLYRKAQQGKLGGGLPGLTTPYEEPAEPEIEVPSEALTPFEAAQEIMSYVRERWLT